MRPSSIEGRKDELKSMCSSTCASFYLQMFSINGENNFHFYELQIKHISCSVHKYSRQAHSACVPLKYSSSRQVKSHVETRNEAHRLPTLRKKRIHSASESQCSSLKTNPHWLLFMHHSSHN